MDKGKRDYSKLIECLKYIKDFCSEYSDCDDCPLCHRALGCMVIEDHPGLWAIIDEPSCEDDVRILR